MDTPAASSALIARLEAASERLGHLAAVASSDRLTAPDPGTGERWEAGQVWAHVTELIPYWRSQAETVVGAASTEPVPFGRVKTDPDRLAAIERGRSTSIVDLASRAVAEIEETKVFASELEPDELARQGVHQTRGVMSVTEILDDFIGRHLEEHAAQLEELAGDTSAGA